MCINCTYYTEGLSIFYEIFRHQRLPKYSIFMCIDCAYYSEGKTIFSMPKDFIFTWIQCMSPPKPQTIFPGISALRAAEIFHFCLHYQVHILYRRQTNNCRNITFSCVLSVHITPMAKKYSFLCILCTFYTEGKAIFSEIFWPQRLPKYSIFMWIDCTYYSECKTIFSMPKDFIFTWIQCTSSWSHKQYFSGILAPRAAEIFHFCLHYQVHILYLKQTNSSRNITFSCVVSVHITLKAKKYSATNSCQNIPFSCAFRAQFILKAKEYSPKHFGTMAAEIFYFHVYWLHILLWRQTIFSEIFQHQLLLKDFIFTIQCTCSPGYKQYSLDCFTPKSQCYFHMYWVSILLWMQNNILQNIPAPTAAENFHFHTHSVHMFPSCKQYFMEYFDAESCRNI